MIRRKIACKSNKLYFFKLLPSTYNINKMFKQSLKHRSVDIAIYLLEKHNNIEILENKQIILDSPLVFNYILKNYTKYDVNNIIQASYENGSTKVNILEYILHSYAKLASNLILDNFKLIFNISYENTLRLVSKDLLKLISSLNTQSIMIVMEIFLEQNYNTVQKFSICLQLLLNLQIHKIEMLLREGFFYGYIENYNLYITNISNRDLILGID